MKKVITTSVILAIVCVAAMVDAFIFDSAYHNIVLIVSAISAFVPCIVFRGKNNAFSTETKLIALMSAVSSVLMVVCSNFSFVKPFSCMTVIAGMYFGVSAGYFCGISSALIFSLYAGIGNWTVFQAISLGIIGLMAGALGKFLYEKKFLMVIFTGISGIAFSCAGVFQSICNAKNEFELDLFVPVVSESMKWFLIYALSDMILLCVINKFAGKRFLRIKKRFGVFK